MVAFKRQPEPEKESKVYIAELNINFMQREDRQYAFICSNLPLEVVADALRAHPEWEGDWVLVDEDRLAKPNPHPCPDNISHTHYLFCKENS